MDLNDLDFNKEFNKFNIIEPPKDDTDYINKPHKLILYKKKTQVGNTAALKRFFDFKFTFTKTYKDVLSVKLLKATLYGKKTQLAVGSGDSKNGTTDTDYFHYVMHIDELNNIKGDNSNALTLNGSNGTDSGVLNRLNDSFATLRIVKVIDEGTSGSNTPYSYFINRFETHNNIKYFNPPRPNLSSLNIKLYAQNYEPVTSVGKDLFFMAEFLIETKSKFKIYNTIPLHNNLIKSDLIEHNFIKPKLINRPYKLMIYKKKIQNNDTSANRRFFDFKINFTKSYKDITSIKLLKARMYITKTGHVYNANTGNGANGIVPVGSGGIKPSLFWFFILDIPELRNIESSTDKSRNTDGTDTTTITRQNTSFAKLYNDVPTIYNGSNTLNQYAHYTNTFAKNHNIIYYDPPIHSLKELTLRLYAHNYEPLYPRGRNIHLMLELLIETKEKMKIY